MYSTQTLSYLPRASSRDSASVLLLRRPSTNERRPQQRMLAADN